MTDELLARIDGWRRERSPLPSRAEAIRDLVEIGLGGSPGEYRVVEPDPGNGPAGPDLRRRADVGRASPRRRAAPSPTRNEGEDAVSRTTLPGGQRVTVPDNLQVGPAKVQEGGERGRLDKGVRVSDLDIPFGPPDRKPRGDVDVSKLGLGVGPASKAPWRKP